MSALPAQPPLTNVETQRFWDATAEGRIELPRCGACDLIIWYPRNVCPDCQSTDLTWTALSGRGTVYSYTVARGGASPGWKQHLPYVVAYVRLDEGPTLLTNLVDCDPESLAIGTAVAVVFDDTGEGSALIRFRPV